ncbi:MAG: GGDEF domain-containing protein [Sphaerochaeta sp.]|jgi:diguanylate cyclase (GGDEF)-like protein|uniref:GGDEF domain-containing protein n=1 Tax=Sphaerochaeta sp. TaxID=1972642 RepID=UPI002FCC5859
MAFSIVEHQIQRILLFLAVIVLALGFYFDSFLSIEPLANEPIVTWEAPWTILDDAEVVAKNVSLPYTVTGKTAGKTITARFTLPDKLPSSATTLLVKTSMSSLMVNVGGTNVYSYKGPNKGWARPVFGGSTPHFIRLDARDAGKVLELVFTFTSDNAFAGHIRTVQAGSKASLLLAEFSAWPSLFFGFALLLLGTLILCFSFAVQTIEERKSFFYFALVLLALGGWVFSQTPSKFLLIRNPALPMNMSFAALYLLPSFLVNYVLHSYPVQNRFQHFQRISLIFILGYIIGGILQVLGIAQYTDLLLYSGFALVVFLLALFAYLSYEYYKGNRALSSFLLSLSCMVFSIVAEEVLLALNIKLDSAVILHFGMALAAVILFWHSVTMVREKTRILCKEQMLLSLAYTDALTAVGNRASFDREVENIVSASKPEVLGILMMDINDLKRINDTQGHKAGDLLLSDFAKRLVNILPASSKIFRYGGDEFIALIPSIRDDQLAQISQSILTYFSSSGKVSYEVAVGWDLYIPKKKEKFLAVVNRADAAMYRCKNAMKECKA